ncbi:MAG: hypothetical protein HY365_03890, partial [Candidatus Aenigmarchaeota archaeon]|nr:hypothetical protein [Candidatus Aenigmarchaeota archaeon]
MNPKFVLFVLALLVVSVSSAAVTVNSPANATNTTDSTPEVYFTITNESASYNFTVYVDGIAAITTNTTNTTDNNTQVAFNFTSLINGTHRFFIEVRNSTNNLSGTNSTLVTITVDNVNPGVSITSPGNSTNTTDSTPEIFFNITDNVHNATNITYRIYMDGVMQTANDTTNNTNIAYNFTALTN